MEDHLGAGDTFERHAGSSDAEHGEGTRSCEWTRPANRLDDRDTSCPIAAKEEGEDGQGGFSKETKECAGSVPQPWLH